MALFSLPIFCRTMGAAWVVVTAGIVSPVLAAQTAPPEPPPPAADAPAPSPLPPLGLTPAPAPPPAPPALPTAAKPERDKLGVINLGKPLNLRWYVLGEMAIPGLGGLRLGAEVYVPNLPIFAAAQFARDWGVDPMHNAGAPDTILTRTMTGTRTWEVRSGLLYRDWTRSKQEMYYDHNYGSHLGSTTFTRDNYELDTPAWRAVALYAGLRYREVPGATTCELGPKGVTENCVVTQSAFLMLGIQRTLSFDIDVLSKEHGALTWRNTKSVDFHLLYAPAEAWGRETLSKRIGAEVVVLHAHPDLGGAVHYGFGWDGQYVLLQGGLGFGSSMSIAGEARSAKEIPLTPK